MDLRHIPLAALALGAGLHAQHSLVFCMDESEVTLDNGDGLVEAGLIRPDETALVTPKAGVYSASVFQSMGAQWAFIGDADADGELLDSAGAGPGGGTDALFVKNFPPPAPGAGPRDVYVSKLDAEGFGSGVENGDVFRYASQGVLDVFVSEGQLLTALGQSALGDLNTDAICQAGNGDLFVSFADQELCPGGTADDGGLLRIPVTSITYAANGNVSAIAAGSAQLIAQEPNVNAWIAASGVKTSGGAAPTTSIDLAALELDPAGGTFEAPLVPGLMLPNLLFAWSGVSNEAAVLSTSGGGTLATLNGVALASATATTGVQLGLLPDAAGVSGLMGLAIIPERLPPQAVEVYPTGLITGTSSLWSRQEVSGATPGGAVIFLVDGGPTGPGSVVPSLMLGSVGEFFSDGILTVLATQTADAGGYAGNVVTIPGSLVGLGFNMIFQTFDVTSFKLGTPAPLQFF